MTIEDLEAELLKLAPYIDEYFNPDKGMTGQRKIGFLLCAFEFGEKGSLAYLANAQQADLAKALTELISRLHESRAVTSPGGG